MRARQEVSGRAIDIPEDETCTRRQEVEDPESSAFWVVVDSAFHPFQMLKGGGNLLPPSYRSVLAKDQILQFLFEEIKGKTNKNLL